MCYRIVIIILSFLMLGGCNDEGISTDIIKYTLEYDVKEGYPSISSSQHESGEVISLSTVEPKLNEHEFKGWLYKGRVYLPGEFFEVNNDVVLHAVWEPILYEISYYSEAYHDVPYNREYFPKGTTMKLSSNIPFKEGYTFHYWENNQDAYYPAGDYLVLGNTTFVAKWSINSYSLTYDENNGSLSPIDGGEHTYGSYVTVRSEVPIKPDYTFQHWLDEASNTTYLSGSTIQLTKDISLVAQWKETEIFSITYHYKNGVVETQTYQNVEHFFPYLDSPLSYSYRYWHTDQQGGSEGEQIQRNEPVMWEGDNHGSMHLYETGWVKGENHRWGSGISDNLYINQISIPGTHDSAADNANLGCTAFVNTIVVQSESISQQLAAGVRFFDIRTRFYKDSFPLHHGSCFLETHFDTEMKHIKDFLIENPSEFIVIMMKKEYKTEGNTKTYQQVFDDYLKELDMVDMWDLTSEFKTIKELRGKVILVDRTYEIKGGISIDNWRDNIKGTQYVGWNNVDVEAQDFYSFGYTDSSVDGKKDVIMNLINQSSSVSAPLSSTLTLNFTSGYFNYWTGVPALGDSRINPWLNEYLSGKSGKHLGVIVSDYNSSNARQSLKDNIIKQNFVN